MVKLPGEIHVSHNDADIHWPRETMVQLLTSEVTSQSRVGLVESIAPRVGTDPSLSL